MISVFYRFLTVYSAVPNELVVVGETLRGLVEEANLSSFTPFHHELSHTEKKYCQLFHYQDKVDIMHQF